MMKSGVRVEMKKRAVIIPAVLLGLILLATVVTFYNGSNKGFEIQINNRTDKRIEGLKITYNGLYEDVSIKPVDSRSTYSFNIKPQEAVEGSSLIIYYFDKSGVRHEKTLVECFEKGNWGRVVLDITLVDENNVITLMIKESATIGKVEGGNTVMPAFVGGFIIIYFLLIIFGIVFSVLLFILALKALKALNIYISEHQSK